MSRPVVLRRDVVVEDPLSLVLDELGSQWPFDVRGPTRSASFDEADIRHANRGGARISAAEVAGILERRPRIQRALRAIEPAASLARASSAVPWAALGQLFDAFAGIRGVGCSKMTKALHRKRPALIPMLDSVVQQYLVDDDLGPKAPFAERTLKLVRGYKRDLDRNRTALRSISRELAVAGHDVSEVRVLDLLIWSVETAQA